MTNSKLKIHNTYKFFNKGRQANVVLILISLILFPFKYLLIITLSKIDININRISDIRRLITSKSISISYGSKLYW